MASRSYNPSPSPISNSIEDTLEYYNMRKNPNSQPMIFKRPPVVVIRDTPRQDIGRLYGGNMKKLEMDEEEPQRRPAGYVEPHSSSAKKFIANGNSASYPVFNSVEQKEIDGKRNRGRPRKEKMEGAGIAVPKLKPVIDVPKLGEPQLRAKMGEPQLRGSGVSSRAEIVRKIMAEKGMGLIEASSYVKANNLYTAKPKTPRGKKSA